jgi:hypothetical protein
MRGGQKAQHLMAKAERVELIKQLQEARGGTYVISYITSTRQELEVQMAMDAVRLIYEHLRLIDKPKEEAKIDLFLHSNGGDGTVPWRLVTLIREFTDKFSVLVPYRAFSAATLTALGAHSVVMHRMGMLGPTDPTVTNPFNPEHPTNPEQRIGISVEDVTAYIALIKEDAGIHHEDELVQAFNMLAEKVHPLALGNVKRSLSQSRMMARKLLALHMDNSADTHRIDEIVDSLTSKLFYHGHPINRQEAIEQVKLPTVEIPSVEVEELMWKLYLEYEAEIRMEEPFQAAMEFTSKHPGTVPKTGALTTQETSKLAFIESAKRTDFLSIDYQLGGQPHPATGGVQVSVFIRRQGWQPE